MKKLYMIWMFALMATFSFSQKIYDREFKPFKMDFGVGYAMPKGVDVHAGPLFSIEPKYAFTGDAFTFGFRIQTAMLKLGGNTVVPANGGSGGGSNATTGSTTLNTAEVNAHLSGSITCDYFFSNNYVRPFFGMGPGFYSIATEVGKAEGALLPDYTFSNKFGGMFRSGVEIGHVRASAEYNLITANKSMNGYFGVKLGLFVGGGRFELISSNRKPF